MSRFALSCGCGGTFSLRWKLLLVLGVVLVVLFITYAVVSEVNLQRQYANARAAEQERAFEQLHALQGQSRSELLNLAHLVRSLSGIPEAISADNTGRLRKLFAKQWATLQIDTDMASAVFVDAAGQILTKEHIFAKDYSLPPRVSSAIESTLEQEEPQLINVCRTHCLIYAIAPIAVGGETVGAVALGRTLDDLVIRFQRISRLDIAILAASESGSPLADGSLDTRLLPEGGELVAITNRDNMLPLLIQEAEKLVGISPPATNKQRLLWRQVEHKGRQYELMPLAMTGMGDGETAMAVVIADVTEARERITDSRWQSFAISSGGLTVFALLIVGLTRNPLQRLRQIAEQLPLLAEQRFAAVRGKLSGHSSILNDELDQLERTILSLADRLELLETQVEERNRTLAAKLEELSIERERYELAAAGANDGLWDWRLDIDEVYYSPRWYAMVGCNEERSTSSTPEEWLARIHPDEQSRVRQELNSHLQGVTSSFESEHRVYHETLGYRWMLVRGLAVRRSNGTAYRMAGSMSDVTERRLIQQQLEHDALHDALTGLPNRNLLLDRLRHAIDCSRRSQEGFAVLFLDLDDFKTINDGLGHVYGDQVLIEVGQRLAGLVRPGDTVARLGGDEFVILLEQTSKNHQVDQVIERIGEAMGEPIQIGPQEVFAGFSVGITLGESQDDNQLQANSPRNVLADAESAANALLRNADTAMYHAKSQNRGSRMFFDWSMHDHAVFRLNLEVALRRALESSELELHYQPIVSLPEGRLLGFEALARWPQQDGSWVSPGDFIPLAERTGLIIPLGRWVIEAAIDKAAQVYRLCSSLSEQGIFFNLNVSGKQLRDPELIQTLQGGLQRHGLPGECLKVEITESAIVENADKALEIMRSIRNTGARLCIDDFGTGYSSLSQLRDLPFDVLKIDRSFVSRSGENTSDDAIIEAIMSLARALDKEVVAEGIEYYGQIDHLVQIGCREGQGFLFSRPLNPEALERLIREIEEDPEALKLNPVQCQ